MIYPPNFEQKIGFDSIRLLLKEMCISEMGVQFVDKINFTSNAEIVQRSLNQVNEFVEILTIGKSFPNQDYFDLREELLRIKTPGSYIEQEALFDLKSSLITIREILYYFEKSDKGKYTELKELTNQIDFPEDVLTKADNIVDEKGNIRDGASAKLHEIRREILQKQRMVNRETKKAYEKALKAGFIPENAEITLRNGRMVIPLKAAEKRSISGFIQDESATGQTVFIEPTGAFEANNEIRALENEERREIIKILTSFTDDLRPFVEVLSAAYSLLGLMDFIRAKALLAVKLNASRPVISNNRSMEIKEAVHPLLFLSHNAQNKNVVPLDMALDDKNRILIISGPNAGGKSVCLKTVGLLQYMLQCGLLVPASPNSEFVLFSRIFIDIGDEQSLENDLSTYSSHLLNMKYFLQHATNDTLFLIDEFGTGTEPQLGASIAEATLEQLNDKKAFGVITTHYSNLKILAEQLEGLQNGAMLFDTEQMQPLFKLKIGKPGSSFAFEIARKIGFPASVLQKAKKKSGGKHIKFDQQLQQLETDKIAIEKKQKQLDSADETLSELVERYTNLVADLTKTKKQIIEDAKKEAADIIEGSNKAIEKTIREIKEAQANKQATKRLRIKLAEKKLKLKNETKPISEAEDKEHQADKISPGSYVVVKGTDIEGELLSIDHDEALINVNDIKLRISLDKLESKSKKPLTRIRRNPASSIMNEITTKAANFELSIDLRGKRSEEALYLLQRYIDEALLLSIKEVSILHGKGFGILRDNIREYLQSVDEVKHFGDAPLNMGGAGITRVYFK